MKSAPASGAKSFLLAFPEYTKKFFFPFVFCCFLGFNGLAQNGCLPAPNLAAAAVTQICPGQSASLILDNLGAGQEALWYADAGLSTLLYQNAANLYQPSPSGNTTYYGVVYDNLSNCYSDPLQVNVLVGGGTANISGNIRTELGNGIESVQVTLSGNGVGPFTTYTNNMGNYSFSGVPTNASYKIRVSLNTNPLNGVTTFDLVLMVKHILGLELLNSPYKIIAADVNLNGLISVSDAVETRMLILGILTEFIKAPSWQFVPADYVFPDPTHPFTPAIPFGFRCVNLSCDAIGQDFIGIKTGDLNNNAVSNN